MECVIGLYKTELIKPRGPWKGLDDLEIATAEWVDWYNHRRSHEYCDDLTPVEAEQAHYAHHQEDVPGFVELEVAVPRPMPSLR
jgi:putative transposase